MPDKVVFEAYGRQKQKKDSSILGYVKSILLLNSDSTDEDNEDDIDVDLSQEQ